MFSLFKKTNKISPQYWNEYIEKFPNVQKTNIPINKTTFIVLDIETTGLDVKRDKILSIGALKIENNQIKVSDSLEIYISQNELNPQTVLIHGIRKNGGQEKISEENAIIKLLDYLQYYVIVGHSIVIDISFINELLNKYAGGKLKNKSIDTVNLYKRWNGADHNYSGSSSLDSLSKQFHIPQSDRHNAAGDAFITAILFMKLVSRLEIRGVTELKDLIRVKRTLI